MRITESCVSCLYKKQSSLHDDEDFKSKVKAILDNRSKEDTAPYLIYQFTQLSDAKFGKKDQYSHEKKQFNDLALSLEDSIRDRIEHSEDPLKTSLFLARVGNYIDFGAMNHGDENKFMELLFHLNITESDEITYKQFIKECETARNFLLLADNCGEIVMDKLFIEQLKKNYPNMEMMVMVRGGDILNDATVKDAYYIHMDDVAKIISNGKAVAGTEYRLMSEEAKDPFDHADIIFSKGQGNYESVAGNGWHVYYSFLCKCDLFTNRFNVPQYTGMFVVE